MHRTFQVAELVALIVEHVVVTENLTEQDRCDCATFHLTNQSRHDMESLALTARLFREPTLDVIWRGQSQLRSLMRSIDVLENVSIETSFLCLMTFGARRVDGWSRMPEFYKLKRPLTPEDVPTLLRYSSRIKTLGLTSTYDFTKDFPNLHTGHLGTIFPKLKVICCCPYDPAMLKFVIRGAGSALSKFDYRGTIRLHSSLLATISLTASTLQSLKLTTHMDPMILRGSTKKTNLDLCATLRQMTRLQSLDLLADLDESVWNTIAQMTTLEKLRIGGWDSAPLPSKPIPPSSFPALRLLNLTTEDVPTMISILQTSVFPELRSLSCVFEHPLHHRAAALLEAVCHCSPATLERFTIQAHKPPRPLIVEWGVIGGATLASLFRFRHLQVLQLLTPQWALSITNDDVGRMAQAWPDLIELEFVANDWFPWSRSQSQITLLGLHPLAANCPRLRSLVMNICDEMPVAGDDDGIADCRSESKIFALCVGRAKLQSDAVGPVAAVLGKMFPTLVAITAKHDRARWNEVAEIVSGSPFETSDVESIGEYTSDEGSDDEADDED